VTILTIYLKQSFTYDHRTLKTRLPVRSALFKQRTGGLVVRWVTTSEYPLLYVFRFFWSMPCFLSPSSVIQSSLSGSVNWSVMCLGGLDSRLYYCLSQICLLVNYLTENRLQRGCMYLYDLNVHQIF
jgi:hypothetical protein